MKRWAWHQRRVWKRAHGLRPQVMEARMEVRALLWHLDLTTSPTLRADLRRACGIVWFDRYVPGP